MSLRVPVLLIIMVVASCCILPFASAETVETGTEDVIATYTFGKTERVLHTGDKVPRTGDEITFTVIASGQVQMKVDGEDRTLDVSGFTAWTNAFTAGEHKVHFIFESGRVISYVFTIAASSDTDDGEGGEVVTTDSVTLSYHNSQITNTLIMTFLLTLIGFYCAYKYVRYRKSMEVSDV